MNTHYCTTEDGMRIFCLCSTGRDHAEEEFGTPPGKDKEEGDE